MKKIGVRLLLWIFKALIGIKKGVTFLIFSVVRKPASMFWRGACCPVLAFVYSRYRRVHRIASHVYRPARGQLKALVVGKYATQVLAVVMAFLVTANNIYANDDLAKVGPTGSRSILASATQFHGEDEIVVEEALDIHYYDKEVAYLGGHAISIREYYPTDEELGGLVGIAEHGNAESNGASSHIINAVRVIPESESGDSLEPTRTKIIDYVVEQGDSTGKIAQKFGLKTNTILLANDLSSRSIIRPGQTLRILPVDGIAYKVKKGDTILQLAKKYKADTEEIFEMNGLSDETWLRIGEELILPDATPPSVIPTVRRITPSIKNVFTPPSAADTSSNSRLLWPTAARRITQYFSWRHRGLDIAGPMQTPIFASADGTVTYSGWNSGGYGNMIIIDHGGGLYTRYGHATRNLVKSGDQVKRGDVIQLMGSTGRSTGPHLHFEVTEGSTYNRVNPLNYIQ